MSRHKKKKNSKDILMQKSFLQRDVMAEMESLKDEIKDHFEKLNTIIIKNEEL